MSNFEKTAFVQNVKILSLLVLGIRLPYNKIDT
jgi:hypothetical protein